MVKTLLNKGWGKNEILFEMQRLYGNDVIIFPKYLDDERSLVGKMVPVMAFCFGLSSLAYMYKSPGSAMKTTADMAKKADLLRKMRKKWISLS